MMSKLHEDYRYEHFYIMVGKECIIHDYVFFRRG